MFRIDIIQDKTMICFQWLKTDSPVMIIYIYVKPIQEFENILFMEWN